MSSTMNEGAALRSREANRNLARFTALVAIALVSLLAFGYVARSMDVELPEVYAAAPVAETADR